MIKMPNTRDFSNQEDYMKVCVPERIKEGDDQDKAVASCMNMWKEGWNAPKKESSRKLTFKTMALAEAPEAIKNTKNRIKGSEIDSGLTSTQKSDDEHVAYGIVSTDDVDTDGDVIEMEGLNTKTYESNPLFYYNHEHSFDFNIGKSIGLWKYDHYLVSAFEFDKTQDSLGDKLYKLYKEGRMSQFSIGFEENEVSEKPSVCAKYGSNCKRVIKKATLYEISAVDMGANTETKVLEVKSMEKPIDRSYSIPYLAGTNKDNTKVYIDKDLPQQLDIDGKLVDVTKYLVCHEETEKPLMDSGKTYQEAHKVATETEKSMVEADGLKWESYDKVMQDYIKADEEGHEGDYPDDLETCPYEDEDDMQELKSNSKELTTKQETVTATEVKTEPIIEPATEVKVEPKPKRVIEKVVYEVKMSKRQLMAKGRSLI